MQTQTRNEILTNNNFHKLVSVRRRVSWSFLLVLLGSYLAFGLLSVYSPALLARPVFSDGVVRAFHHFVYHRMGRSENGRHRKNNDRRTDWMTVSHMTLPD